LAQFAGVVGGAKLARCFRDIALYTPIIKDFSHYFSYRQNSACALGMGVL
jgi:hypothetical protein